MSIPDAIREFFDLVSQRDLSKMEDFLTADAEFYFPKAEPLVGKERILRFFGILFRQYPQLHFTLHGIVHQDDRSAVHWTNQGVSRKKEPYQNEGVTWLEWKGGKIRFISDFFKNTEKF